LSTGQLFHAVPGEHSFRSEVSDFVVALSPKAHQVRLIKSKEKMAASAFAGTWGSQKLHELGKSLPSSKVTTYKEQFGDSKIIDCAEKLKLAHSKFKSLQDNNTMILTYEDKSAHAASMSCLDDRSSVGEERSVNSHLSSVSTIAIPVDPPPPCAMVRTQQKVMRTSMAAVAVGRSGHRVEQGINASGLLGERLQLSTEPTRNSFVQRSWLPYDDPALLYKVNGKPEAYMPNDVSLDLSHTNRVSVGWTHGRKYAFTNPFTKTKSSGPRVFQDDP